MKSFTLVEIIIVCVLIGIMLTFAVPAFYNAKLRAEDREARAMLRMIKAAENVIELETNAYVACASAGACNTALRLELLPTSVWTYSITLPVAGQFEALATGAGTQDWCFTESTVNMPDPAAVCAH